MARASDLLALARKELGVKESPAGSNNVKYNTAYYGQEVWDGKAGGKYPWCMVFQWWVFQEASVPELFYGGKKTASCGTLMDYARSHGQLVTFDYAPGDLLFLRFNTKRTTPEHVGILKEIRANGTFVTIEGNTGLEDDANGGQVQQRVRYGWQVLSAYRPHYDKEEATVDNNPSASHKEGVEWAVKNGILRGNGNGDLMLRQNVTREQLCTMLHRTFELLKK